MAQHRMGIIGLGMAVTPHVKSLRDLADRVEVAYGFSRTEARRAAFDAKFPGYPLTGNMADILNDETIDCVLVLTTPDAHLDVVAACAAAGKHVLLEKPLEINSARSVQMIKACRDAGVRLGIVLQHRHRQAGIRLREILAEGRLGPIVGASVYIPCWRPQNGYYDQPGRGDKLRDGGGVLLTQGIHTLDLFLSLVGQPVEVTGYAQTTPVHQIETEDIVAAGVRFDDGAIGVVDATTAAYPGFPERIQILCRNGAAVINGTELVVGYHDGRVDGVPADAAVGGTGADPMDFPHDHHREVIRDFLDALDEDRDPLVSGEDALRTHRFIDALLEAGETVGRVKVVRD